MKEESKQQHEWLTILDLLRKVVKNWIIRTFNPFATDAITKSANESSSQELNVSLEIKACQIDNINPGDTIVIEAGEGVKPEIRQRLCLMVATVLRSQTGIKDLPVILVDAGTKIKVIKKPIEFDA